MTNGNQPATARAERRTVEVRVRGTVQGVGFRPTVWRLDRQEALGCRGHRRLSPADRLLVHSAHALCSAAL